MMIRRNRRVAIYTRVSTDAQSRANQEQNYTLSPNARIAKSSRSTRTTASPARRAETSDRSSMRFVVMP